jgi:pantoate--beta-alanine ligase
MYPEGSTTRIEVGGPSQGLETDFRPHFFGGVAIVVAKLLNQVQADIAVFGEKDYQQLLVVRRMARDLDIPTRIVGSPTLRDGHGLALSSRNAYLSDSELAVARQLNGILAQAGAAVTGGTSVEVAQDYATRALLAAGFRQIDYVAVRRAEDLTAFEGRVDAPARILAAAWLGRTRLIDNLPI